MEKANNLLKIGISLYKAGNYNESYKNLTGVTRLDPENAAAYHYLGLILFQIAKSKNVEKYYRESCKNYERAVQIKKDYTFVLQDWGIALYVLQKNKEAKFLFMELCKRFAQAVNSAQIKPKDFNIFGTVLYEFAKTYQEEPSFKKSLFTEAVNCFKKSGKDILEILVSFHDKEDREYLIEEKIFHQFLLSSDNFDGHIFNEAIKNIKDEKVKKDETKLEKYRKAYIRSISVISLLHVNNENEKLVATYREKTISQQMLLNDTKFRLTAVNYSNDPTEGKILFDYLFGKEKLSIDESINREYGEFAGCFIFNHDSLNMFRLYGKEEGKEGTGLSLVFKSSFFREKPQSAQKQLENIEDSNIDEKETKHALFRCIYIDPETRRVENVGYKEDYLFYRNEKEIETDEEIRKKIFDYHRFITDITENVRIKMEELKKLVENLEMEVVGQLLLNLRYLIKHIAFKEEQECRILKIDRLKNNTDIKLSDDYKQMYIEYNPKVSSHVEKVIFGPKADGMELFRDMLTHKSILTFFMKNLKTL